MEAGDLALGGQREFCPAGRQRLERRGQTAAVWNPPLDAIRPSGFPGSGGKYTGFTETERSAAAAPRSDSATARRASPSGLGMTRKLTGA